jgi:hypothetical protein
LHAGDALASREHQPRLERPSRDCWRGLFPGEKGPGEQPKVKKTSARWSETKKKSTTNLPRRETIPGSAASLAPGIAVGGQDSAARAGRGGRTDKMWRAPNGARLRFAYLERDADADLPVSAPASSIRSAPSYWSVPLPCGKACASCALSYHAFSPRPAMPCRHACCASSRIWQRTGRRLDERIGSLSSEIEVLARRDVGCERLMSVRAIGPTISSAMVAAIGSGDELVSLPSKAGMDSQA